MGRGNDCLKEAGIIIALNVGAQTRKSMPLLTILDKRSLFAGSAKTLLGR
jgi:hypothetical protein